MKTKHLVLLTFILLGFCVLAQEQEEYDFSSEQTYAEIDKTSYKKIKHHSVYVELGGNSIVYSLNYDYTFSLSESTKLAIGAGFEYLIMNSSFFSNSPYSAHQDKPFLFITPAVNLLCGKKSHHLELGISAIYLALPSARIGYRYQPAKGGFFFRIGYTPVLIFPIHWGGISFGYTF
jgi:hypothetical protein